MCLIVPSLILRNVAVSWTSNLLEDNKIDSIVSLVRILNRDCYEYSRIAGFGVAEDRRKWIQCVDSSTQDLLVYMSDICDFID